MIVHMRYGGDVEEEEEEEEEAHFQQHVSPPEHVLALDSIGCNGSYHIRVGLTVDSYSVKSWVDTPRAHHLWKDTTLLLEQLIYYSLWPREFVW